MPVPILETKLTVPQLPAGYLPRRRLDTLWKSWADKRLITLTAGAGFGKTSFLTAGLHAQTHSVIWYALDHSDADSDVFRAHLAQACELALADKAPPHDPGSDIDTFLSGLIGRLSRAARHLLLVLDDVQLVGRNQDVMALLDRLLHYLPQNVTLILSSREPVSVATVKLQAQGLTAELTAQDLRFTAEETRRLFHHRFDAPELPLRLAREITDGTEGWALGIELFFQILPGTAEPQISSALERFGCAGSRWFNYFAEEVLADLDDTTRSFLLKSCLLPRLEPRLCDQVLGRSDSQRRLADLCKRNLFTFPADDQQGTYRYHHLFQEFLREQLASSASAREIDRLRRRIGQALRRDKKWIEALEVFSDVGDTESVLALIDRHTDALLAAGQYDTLNRLLRQIPAKDLGHSCEALYLDGHVHNIRGRWKDAADLFRKALRRDPSPTRRAELQSLIAQLHMRHGKFDSCQRLCRKALAEKGWRSTLVRGRLLGLQGVSWCALGDLDKGEALLNEAVAVCRKGNHRSGEGRYLYLLAANVYHARGDYGAAEISARNALTLFQDLGDRRLICHSMGVLGFVLAAAGQTRSARSLSEDALRRAEGLGYRNIEGYCHLNLGQCAMVDGGLETAGQAFATARTIGGEVGEVSLQALAGIGLAQVAIGQGYRPAAGKYAARALAIATENGDDLPRAMAAMALGLACENSPRKARRHWQEAAVVLERLGAALELNRLRLWQLNSPATPEAEKPALLDDLLDDTAAHDLDFLFLRLEPRYAVKALTRAIADAGRPDIHTTRAMNLLAQLGDLVVPQLEALLENNTHPCRPQAIKLLQRIGTPGAQDLLTTYDDATSDQTSGAPANEQEQVPDTPLEIRALGPLQITVGSRVLTMADWKSGRAFRLLQLLLAKRLRWIPRDIILEALWPDTHPRKANNSLRQTIHILRRTLEPDLDSARKSHYVQLRNDTYRLAVGEKGSYDVLEFEALLSRAEVAKRQQDTAAEIQTLTKAMALYRGPFLEESPYEEFTDQARESLRFGFQRSSERLIGLLADDGRWSDMIPLCRTSITQSPFSEYLNTQLITAQIELGHKQEALADYHRFEQILARELDLLPPESMRLLAERAITLVG